MHQFTLSRLLMPLVFGVCCLFSQVRAQNESFIHHTTRDGLLSGYIWCMMQDSQGFIWIGTNAGLSRFDGYDFTSYVPAANDPTAISGQYIRAMREIDNQRLLIATMASLEVFDLEEQTFKRLFVPDSIPQLTTMADMVVMDNGDIWALSNLGLYHIPDQDLSADTLQVSYYSFDAIDAGNQNNNFYCLEYDGDSLLWLGADIDIYSFNIHEGRFVERKVFDREVENVLNTVSWDIHKASNGDMLISCYSGLLRWRPGADSPELVKTLGPYNEKQLGSAAFQAITEDEEGRIWLGTGNLGAIHWDLSTDEVVTYRHEPNDQNSISSDDVHYAFTDDQQNTWFGYHVMGVSMMYSVNWKYDYQLPLESAGPEDPANEVIGYAQDDQGNLYFATPAGLVYDPADGRAAELYELPDELDLDEGLGYPILRDDHILLISGYGNRFFTFDRTTKTFEIIPSRDSLGMVTIAPGESPSSFYFSTLTGKILELMKSDYTSRHIGFPRESMGGSFKPTIIGNDPEGNLIAQQVDFIPGDFSWDTYSFDPVKREFSLLNLELPDNIANLYIPHISRYTTGVIWNRTNLGILRQDLNTGETRILFQSDVGLINEGSGFILEDKDGFLWMNNQTGIMKLDPITQTITNYELSQDPRKVRFDWVDELKDGGIIFYGKGGYIRFNPEDLEQENPVQNIYITDLFIGDRRYEDLDKDADIRIDHADNNLSFSFIGLNYRNPVYTRYRYRLVGYDQEWNEVGTQRRIYLANLPPGKYTFEVQAATRFGPYSENLDNLAFTILPPWWQTLPAYVMYGLLLIGGVIAFDRVQRKRLIIRERERTRDKELEQAREIEKAYKELKATQAQLIHSEKMASLGELTAGIAHEIQNPLNFVNNFSELNAELLDELQEEISKGDYDEVKAIAHDLKENEQKINHHGKRAEGIVKGMLQHSRGGSSKKEYTDVNVLADEYLRLSYHGLRAKDKSFNADFKANLDPDLPRVMAMGQDIGRVLLNLINNAFFAVDKKGKEGIDGYKPMVTVSTRSSGDQVEIRVRDNGEGIPGPIKEKIFQPFFTTKPTGQGTGLGLSLSYDIITKGHGGTIKLETEEGKGTEFIIELPIENKS